LLTEPASGVNPVTVDERYGATADLTIAAVISRSRGMLIATTYGHTRTAGADPVRCLSL